MSPLLTRLFFGGFVRLHVLYHAVKEPVFGVEMMEELAPARLRRGAGTLYPMLHQLEEAGYLSSRSELVGGKAGSITGRLRKGPLHSRRPGEAPRAGYRGP